MKKLLLLLPLTLFVSGCLPTLVLFFFATREPSWAREQRLEKEARETREIAVAPEDYTKK